MRIVDALLFRRCAFRNVVFAAATLIAAGGAHAQSNSGALPSGLRVLLTPARETTLVAQMVGRVDRLGGELGSAFREGAALVQFDCGELIAKERMSVAEYDGARQQLEVKQRLQNLQGAGEAEVQQAQAMADKTRAQIDVTRAQMRQCRVGAPFAGRIVKLHVKQYQSVNVGQPLVDIVSTGPLKVRLNAPSKWLSWLKVGTPFEIIVDETGKTYPAQVTAVNGKVDAVSQSIEIEGAVRGTHSDLLAGMSGNARFAQDTLAGK